MNKLSQNPVLKQLKNYFSKKEADENQKRELERLAEIKRRRTSDEIGFVDTYYLEDSGINASEFIQRVTDNFPMIIIEDASDYIHGIRKMCYLPYKYHDLFKLFVFSNGWSFSGLAFNMELRTSKSAESVFKEYVQKAYKLYSDNCKKNFDMNKLNKYLY